ncbi:MAG: phasin family protein [Caldilineales bacterium]
MQKKIEAAISDVVETTKNSVEDFPEMVEQTAVTMLSTVRRVLLASVGVVALTRDEIEDFVNHLVERGEIAEQDGRRLIRETLRRQRGGVEEIAEKVQDGTEKQVMRAENALDHRIETVLGRLNVPSKNDIDQLSDKISSLAKKVDALKKA